MLSVTSDITVTLLLEFYSDLVSEEPGLLFGKRGSAVEKIALVLARPDLFNDVPGSEEQRWWLGAR